MKVLLAAPRGFCAGVNMAIQSLDLALDHLGAPIYVYHEIVHNKYVVETFQQKGAIFVDSLEDVPAGATLLFSAHGISPEVRQRAAERQLFAIDATCPLVTKVHLEAIRFSREGYTILLIGHEGHDEVIGTMGEAPEAILLVESPQDVDQLELPADARVAYLTQTTLSVDDTRDVIDALRNRFPKIVGPDVRDICYATQNRQSAVRVLALQSEIIIVLGAQNSSNSNRLREIGEELGVPTYLVDDAQSIDPEWFKEAACIGLTAGASAPEALVQEMIERLRDFGEIQVCTLEGNEENVQFKLPDELNESVA